MTMPELLRWFQFLSARLRHVRILCGDWKRAVTHGATKTLSVDTRQPCGVLLDPPYDTALRDSDLYAEDSGSLSADVRAWALEHGDDPEYRIVVAGFGAEHSELEAAGWRVVGWYTTGFLTGGMGNIGGNSQQDQERLWLSPHCVGGEADPQLSLFGCE